MRKGITATSVAIMVLVIMILIGTITTLSYSSIENAKKTTFSLEISNLQETVDKYITDSVEGDYPILGNEYLIDLTDVSDNSISQFNGETKNTNDEIVVYELYLSALGITDTVYGNKKTEKDVYVVSKTTGRVYYLEGIKSKNVTYYTLTADLLKLKDKKVKQEEQVSSKKPTISTDGFVIKTLSNGKEEIYLSNIKAKNNPKIFKYEIGIIPEAMAKEYFKYNGKTILGDRLNFRTRQDITLYAENDNGEYAIKYCLSKSNDIQDNVEEALADGLKIGDIITGYTITSKTETSNQTANGSANQTVSNKTNFVWRYIGINSNGEIMIAPDLVAGSPTVGLYGRVGCVNGPAELDRLCNVLYTTDKGIARSMDIDDVINILGYIGPRAGYHDMFFDYVPTNDVMTIGDIENEINQKLSSRDTPDGKDVSTYKSDYYEISKTGDTGNMTYADRVNLIYYNNLYYWLASSCVGASFSDNCAINYVRFVQPDNVIGYDLYYFHGGNKLCTVILRPVVSLKTTVQLTKQSNDTWSII